MTNITTLLTQSAAELAATVRIQEQTISQWSDPAVQARRYATGAQMRVLYSPAYADDAARASRLYMADLVDSKQWAVALMFAASQRLSAGRADWRDYWRLMLQAVALLEQSIEESRKPGDVDFTGVHYEAFRDASRFIIGLLNRY